MSGKPNPMLDIEAIATETDLPDDQVDAGMDALVEVARQHGGSDAQAFCLLISTVSYMASTGPEPGALYNAAIRVLLDQLAQLACGPEASAETPNETC